MTQRRGFTLVEVLISIFIFGILAAIVVNNLGTIRKQGVTAEVADAVYRVLQRAHTLAVSGATVRRCSQDQTIPCTSNAECGGSNTCRAPILPLGWGVHYTAPVTPNLGVFQVYGDQVSAVCEGGPKAGDVGAGCEEYLVCNARANRRFDLYPDQRIGCAWSGCYFPPAILHPNDPMTCTNAESWGADLLDLDTAGTYTVPSGITITVKRQDGVSAALLADVNFDITTGLAYIGTRTLTNGFPSFSTRDPVYTMSPAGKCPKNKPQQCYDSKSTLTTICISLGSSGPFNRIRVYSTGLVVYLGGGSPSC